MIFVGVIGFLLGGFAIYSIYKENGKAEIVFEVENSELFDESVYASSRGTKYYYWWCGSNIKEENKVWFKNSDEAIEEGYSLSKTCL